jgi:hypothetical protein
MSQKLAGRNMYIAPGGFTQLKKGRAAAAEIRKTMIPGRAIESYEGGTGRSKKLRPKKNLALKT